jgi:hypothetical protein
VARLFRSAMVISDLPYLWLENSNGSPRPYVAEGIRSIHIHDL